MITMDAMAIRRFVDELESFTKCKTEDERNHLEHLASYIISCAINNFTEQEVEGVIHAIYLSAKHHEGVYRDSGEAYLMHPLRVACKFMSLGLCDYKLTIATVLHDVVEDKTNKKERRSAEREIKDRFGDEIVLILKFVTKKLHPTKTADLADRERHFSELANSIYWRDKLLRIGDRHDNIETLHARPTNSQISKIDETHRYFPVICSTLFIRLKEDITITDKKGYITMTRRIVLDFQKSLNNFKPK